MRHGSHGDACLDASPTTADAKKLNNRARLVVCAGRAWSGVTAAPRDMGRPRHTTFSIACSEPFLLGSP
jgi:hypothetical protein